MIVNSAATLKPKAGNEDFAQFINGHYYYVDKTQYLKEIFQPVRLTGGWPPRQMPQQNLWSIAGCMVQS